MVRYDNSLIEEIKANTNIVDVISGYVALKRQGRNYFGLCPFHTEKSPSFSVSESKQIFHCFGCGARRRCDRIFKKDREYRVQRSIGNTCRESKYYTS
ncbi:MAG: hypothetical protein K2H53_02020 [Clostridia bacterium]|nr:hypothetical protein [Clostridia bacterium]